MISNCGHDESGTYWGGAAGDQTGTEWQLCAWYSRPWNCVLRHPDAAVRESIAVLAEKAAKNNLIGYDQYQRQTYWYRLQEAGYDPEKIKTACETDCSAGIIANVKATGWLLGIDNLKNLVATYTGDMRAGFSAAGFKVLTDARYLVSQEYLLRGDILLNDTYHVATNLTTGTKATASSAGSPQISGSVGTCTVTLQQFLQGAVHPQVKTIQRLLNAKGFVGKNGKSLDVDGVLGENTAYAIAALQKSKGMKNINYGSVAAATWRHLLDC